MHCNTVKSWAVQAASLIATLLFALTSTMAQASPHGAELEGSGFTAESGEALYTSICQGCHMEGGKGAAEVGHYPALVGNPTIASDVYVMQMVMYGNRGMPGFAGFLSDEQIAEVVNYVRGNLGDNAFAADLSPDTVADARDPARTDPLE